MSSLIDTYARSCGLEIGKIWTPEKFFPLSNDKYFTIQAGSGQQAKNYDYWNNVIELIYPYLKENNIDLLQIGGKDDILLKYSKDLRGQTTLSQTFYILKRSLLNISNDSFSAHFCGSYNIPLISLYGSTSIQNHGPYEYNKNKTILIESHRNGNIPTFSSQENPKTINYIKPEEIASAIFKVLNIDYKSPINTIYIGNLYNQFIIEWIPDGIIDPHFIPQLPITVRNDLYPNEQNIFIVANNGRKLNIITNKQINLNILNQIKSNIIGITYEILENEDINYIKQLKRLGIKTRFFTKEIDQNKISNLRLKFFDVCFIEHMSDRTKKNFLDDVSKYLNFKLDSDEKFDNIKYRSNKFIVANNKIFTSKAAYKMNNNIQNFEQNICQVIDNEDFWSEYQFFNIFKEIKL